MTFPTGRFVWFEYVSPEPARAQAFHGELFHWKPQPIPAPGLPGGEYTMIAAGPHTLGAWLAPPPGAPPHAHWLAHLQVESAAATCAEVTAAGGKVLVEPAPMGDMGTYAVVADPRGAAFGLWQPAKPDAGDFKGVPGTFCWNELVTDDVAGAVAFYTRVGAFTDLPMDMGPMGTYHVLEHGGTGRAGIMAAPAPGIPSSWVPYVQVASTDDSTARARRLGATVQMEPADVPGVGRIAVVLDPLGAPLGLLQPPG